MNLRWKERFPIFRTVTEYFSAHIALRADALIFVKNKR